MPPAKHLPLAILGLMLLSALAVLILGIHFAREEQIIPIEQDRAPLTSFTARLLGEITDLESLYQNHLLDIRDRLDLASSDIEIAAVCRNIIGVEQVTLFRKNDRRPTFLDLRESDRSIPLPQPRRRGEPSTGEGLIVDVDWFAREPFLPDFFWIDHPGHPPHFQAKLMDDTVLLLRINPEEARAAMESWLVDWLPEALAPLEVADMAVELRNAGGGSVASTGETDSKPALLLPVPSRFGDWHIVLREKTETVVHYHQPVLVGAAALAVLLVVAGFGGFVQQRRALRLAEQRVSFVNRVSHELRTPMTNILLNIDLMAESLPEKSRANRRLDLVRDEAGRLGRLLENVLTFSRREKSTAEEIRQAIRPIPCDTGEAIAGVLSQFTPSLRRKQIAVKFTRPDPQLFVQADPDALNQILGNLVSNVEKHAGTGGVLEITIAAATSGNTIILSVIDDGPGIRRSDVARIFRPFVRLRDTTTEGASGTGLGLAIARSLAETMNGRLECQPSRQPAEDGRSGSRFDLTLPRAADNIITLAS